MCGVHSAGCRYGAGFVGWRTHRGTIRRPLLYWKHRSHPTVGVALFGVKVSDQLGSLGEELPIRTKTLRVCSFQD